MTTVLEELDQLGDDAVLRVEAWTDPLLARLGHSPLSFYVETFWLPVLGPSTVLLLRFFARGLEEAPGGYACDLAEAARALGLGDRRGRNTPFARTVARAVDFDTARLESRRLLVRRHLPPLARRHVARLPEALRAEHERALRRAAAERRPAPHDEQLRRRGRQLALSLLQLGEEPDAVIGHLRRWRFAADLAEACLEWATTQRTLGGRIAEAGGASARPAPGDGPAQAVL